MRQTFAQLTRDKRQQLRDSDPILRDAVDTLMKVELCAVAYRLLDLCKPLHEAWVLLTGYNTPILPEKTDEKILVRLRILLSKTASESNWRDLIELYQEIPPSHRMVHIAEDDTFTFQTPPFDVNRYAYYEKILSEPIPYKETEQVFLSEGKFSYNVYEDQFKIRKSAFIHENLRKKTYEGLTAYRQKKKITFPLGRDWLSVAREMDEQLPVEERNWLQKMTPITLQSLNNETRFTYEGVHHIAGGLASGKSTFRYVQTYWLVKKEQAKVGLVESSVADVLQTVGMLKKLGIHAVPVIGRSNRKQHMAEYLASKNIASITSLGEEQALRYLSTSCTIRAITEDEDKTPRYPCEQLYTTNERKKFLCPLAAHCGVYQAWTELNDADVWVTTSQAVLKTRLPSMIDPYKRYMYEAMYDLLDVIFIDEADAVMRQFDDAFVETYSAFGKITGLFEQLEQQFMNRTQGKYDLVTKLHIQRWQINLSHLKNNIWSVLYLLQNNQHLRDKMRDSIVYVQQLIYEIAQQITSDDKDKEEVIKILRHVRKTASYESSQDRHILHYIVGTDSRKKQIATIVQWLEEVQANSMEQKDEQKLFTKIIFFLHLSHIEAALKYIEYHYHFTEEVNQTASVSNLRPISDYEPFMKEAMTGVMFGYRYVQRDNQTVGNVEVLQYVAVGRELLYRWHNLYEAADEKKGPATVFLSGTSYAPNSLHYHLQAEPTWLIHSTRQQSNLTQTYWPLRNPHNKEALIQISGISDRAERDDYLQLMVKELDVKMKEELAYWRRKEDRRILLVVNAYEDVKVVGQALEALGWKGNYRLLAKQEDEDTVGEVFFPRSQIEHFAEEEAEILVVPLLAINRGYNIVTLKKEDTEAGALFGSVFFLIRPYPVPQDLSYLIQILHGTLASYEEKVRQAGLDWIEAMRYIRKKSRGKFDYMYETPDFWALLKEEEREIVAWYTFVPIWQLIGRLLRGGRDARVFYCDGKFMDRAKGKRSMLESWQSLMMQNDGPIFASLYGPFLRSITEMMKEGVR